MSTATEEHSAITTSLDALYEVVDGEIVELDPMGAFENWLASRLNVQLAVQDDDRTGWVGTEILFDLGAGRNQRRPDLAFVTYERWPVERRIPSGNAWQVVPNLAAEVVSPSNTWNEVLRKLDEYFSAGVDLVWVVVPDTEQVYVYRSMDDMTIVARTGELTGGSVVPQFRLPLADLFGEPGEPSPTN